MHIFMDVKMDVNINNVTWMKLKQISTIIKGWVSSGEIKHNDDICCYIISDKRVHMYQYPRYIHIDLGYKYELMTK